MSKRKLLLLVLCGVCGCSRTVTGPTPAPTAATNPLEPSRSPAEVCNAQGAPAGWRIDLSGDGFSPLPENTLTKTPVLAMPTVSLAGPSAQDLPGSQVFFVDRTHLVLRIPTKDSSPAATLLPGTYDIQVTNPTGKSGTLTAGLTVVPPPTVSSVTPEAGFSTTDPTAVDILGTGFRTDATPSVTLSGKGLPTQTLTGVTVSSPTMVVAQLAANTPPGIYDVTVTNPEGCSVTLAGGLVISYEHFGELAIEPRFGWQLKNQAITISNLITDPANQHGFTGAPEIFLVAPLKGGAGTTDIPLRRVAFVGPSTVNAVVPDCSGAGALPISGDATACQAGIEPGGPYAIKIVDPAGIQGTIPITNGFTVLANPPPVISAISPNGIDTGGSADVKIAGQNFPADAVPQVVFEVGANIRACTVPVTSGAPRSDTELHAVIPTSVAQSACVEFTPEGVQVAATGGFTLSAGLYVIRVQDVSDPASGDFSGLSVTNPSAKGGHGPAISTKLAQGRADFAMVEAQDDVGQHYLYAIGGSDGTNLLSSVEVASLTLFGDLGGQCSAGGCTFRTLDRTPLGVGKINGAMSTTPAPRRALTAVSRVLDTGYVYVIGGQSASGELVNVERAQVLKVADAPDLQPLSTSSGGTLEAATYYYRVSAVMADTDARNPGGETLASDEEPIQVAASGKVDVTWHCVPGAASYRVYRTDAANQLSGTELLLKEQAAAATSCSGSPLPTESYSDTGADSLGTAAPLPPGALGNWVSAGTLNFQRAGASSKVYVGGTGAGSDRLFVGGGFCTATGTSCPVAGDQGTVEVATLDSTLPSGLDLTFTNLTASFAARRHFSFAIADAADAPASFALFGAPVNADLSNDAWLMVVGGDTGGTSLVSSGGTAIEVAKIESSSGPVTPSATSGNFGAPVTSPSPAGEHGGWAEVVANRLFYGGTTSGGGFASRIGPVCPTGTGGAPGPCTQTSDFIKSGLSAASASSAYTTGGSRYLGGEDLFRAYIYVAGGFAADNSTTVTDTVERLTY